MPKIAVSIKADSRYCASGMTVQNRPEYSCEIPESISKVEPAPSPAQDVVRLNFNPKEERTEPMFPVQPALGNPSRISELSARIEISLGDATIRIANGADPAILERILSLVGGTVC